MCDKQLRKLVANFSPTELLRWHHKQLLLARRLRARLSRIMGQGATAPNTTAIEFPQAEEVVAETILRILSRRNGYVWNASQTFDEFFARCLAKSMDSLRKSERRYRNGAAKLDPTLNAYFGTPHPDGRELVDQTDATIARAQSHESLTALVGETRMYGKATTYVERILDYADMKMTKDEIAEDLEISPSSVDPYRKRIGLLAKKNADQE
jgi:DNA-directed RNA polymerase specialized sigma24 family protein